MDQKTFVSDRRQSAADPQEASAKAFHLITCPLQQNANFYHFSHAFAPVLSNMAQVHISPVINVWLENTILP